MTARVDWLRVRWDTWLGQGARHRYRIQVYRRRRPPRLGLDTDGLVRVWEDGATLKGAARARYYTVTEAKAACEERER